MREPGLRARVLILGSGGREHALAWRFSIDPAVGQVWVAPGNPGMTSRTAAQCPVTCVPVMEGEAIIHFVREHDVDLVVIGPEKFLFEGTADLLRSAGVSVLGPDRAAAFLEGSKCQAKEFMRRAGIPTSDFETGSTREEAEAALARHPEWRGYVVKLSGPALGKGVWVCRDQAEASGILDAIYQHRPQGLEDGWVIEEALAGPEVSMFFLCDGNEARFLASARDHKRLRDFDQGPNTGGMGAVSPAPGVTPEFIQSVQRQFADATLGEMRARGTPFNGVLFLGLMFEDAAQGHPRLLEYNVRFGDPETQSFLPLLEGSFYSVMKAAASGRLSECPETLVQSHAGTAVHVVKAARGYPGNFGKSIVSGEKIVIEREPPADTTVFYAGVQNSGEGLVTRGGRVLGMTSVGRDLSDAQARVYQALPSVRFASEVFRSDIGGRNSATRKIRVALFASGAGSNAKALLKESLTLPGLEILLLVVDREDSPLLLEVPEKHPQVKVVHVPVNARLQGDERRREHESRIEAFLIQHQIDWIFLAGYMRVLTPEFAREHSVINIHPSLLPKYPGLHAYEQAWNAGEKVFGITVHHVDEGVDTGKVIEQVRFERHAGERLEDLIERGKRIEWELYGRVLRTLNEKGRL